MVLLFEFVYASRVRILLPVNVCEVTRCRAFGIHAQIKAAHLTSVNMATAYQLVEMPPGGNNGPHQSHPHNVQHHLHHHHHQQQQRHNQQLQPHEHDDLEHTQQPHQQSQIDGIFAGVIDERTPQFYEPTPPPSSDYYASPSYLHHVNHQHTDATATTTASSGAIFQSELCEFDGSASYFGHSIGVCTLDLSTIIVWYRLSMRMMAIKSVVYVFSYACRDACVFVFVCVCAVVWSCLCTQAHVHIKPHTTIVIKKLQCILSDISVGKPVDSITAKPHKLLRFVNPHTNTRILYARKHAF